MDPHAKSSGGHCHSAKYSFLQILLLKVDKNLHEKHAFLFNKKQSKKNKEVDLISLIQKQSSVKNKNIVDVNQPFDYYDIDSDEELEYKYDEKIVQFSKAEIKKLKI